MKITVELLVCPNDGVCSSCIEYFLDKLDGEIRKPQTLRGFHMPDKSGML